MTDGGPVKIYLPRQLARDASRQASRTPQDQSLSAMIRRLLERELAREAKKKAAATPP